MIWIPRILIAMGLVFLATLGLALWLQAGRGGAEKATGSVLRYETAGGRSSSGPGRTLYCPVVGFSTRDGRWIELTSSTCAQPPAYAIGESVEVDYDPAAPEMAAFGGFFTRHLLSLVFGGIGAIFTVLGVVILALVRRRT
ncbi:DUF3592 domain-containing protein [Zavarzinia aquatilis]|uniref:DUF3592 domain-containing protein n=1 Tax=Zavarzinia aquatilis TaxID=2211142 RepID=A0A317E6D2_9PROT|nr:DUF3592 domain-containing protein [Zavarzinia aquatilis]PWR22589.1 hypothetical protein DKG74_12000 [Zavarzinia aquatilis]